jgi:glycosyltransferase involved in cell wall biosynthesis
MRRAQLIAVTSVKEGWGLIITEANSQGTPAVAYDIDGLRDACKNNYTGLITTKNNPSDLAEKMTQLLQDKDLYAQLRLNAWRDSLTYSYDSSYKIFISLIQDIYKKL